MTENNKEFSLTWKFVKCSPIKPRKDVYKQQEIIESAKLSKFRKEDYKGYEKFVENQIHMKIFNKNSPKLHCYIPKTFMETRLQPSNKHDHKNASLKVNINHMNHYDLIDRQDLYKRSAVFRNYLKYQIYEDFTKLPYIEYDAADLNVLLNLSTHKPVFKKNSCKLSQHSVHEKLPILKDLHDKPQPELIVSAYVKEHVLKLPLLIKDAVRVRELYTNCIINDKILKRLFENNSNVLSKDLQDYINDFDFKYVNSVMESNVVKDELADRDQFFHTSIHKHSNDIVEEIENDTMEFSVFTKPFYIYYFSQILPNYQLMEFNDQVSIEKTINSILNQINNHLNNPISSVRKDLMSILVTADISNKVMNFTIAYLPAILNVMLKSLFSLHRKVREEACVCVAFLFLQSKLLYEILNVYSGELIYEIIVVIFKAIEHYQNTFDFYYALLGYIMDNCPIIIILQAICDKAPTCKYAHINKQWPKFIVFACKHWPNESFNDSSVIMKRIIDLLERCFMNKFLTKTTKMALCEIGRRFDRKISCCTYYPMTEFRETDE